MSYDIQVWSVNPASLPDDLRYSGKLDSSEGSWSLEFENWTIMTGPSHEVLPEDIPEDVSPLLPGIRFLTEINLSPFNNSFLARRAINRVAKSIAKVAHGVVFNPQEGSITTPSGVKRYESQKREKRFSIMELNWLFTDGPLLTETGPEDFITFLEKKLPEAMPRRYGQYEPPKHLYAETGREHFLQFIRDEDWNIVWYPTRPVLGVHVTSYGNDWGPSPRGFRVNQVSLGIEAAVMNQPGWQTAIKEIWYSLSRPIVPFYGDVKILDGYIAGGATYGIGKDTEMSRSGTHGGKESPRHLDLPLCLANRIYRFGLNFVTRHPSKMAWLT